MEWNCCRTCLSTIALNPIFSIPSENEKFSEIIHATTGLKVELNDELPQEICTECVNFINGSRRFQNKCYSTQKTLLEKLNNKQFSIIKDELSHIFKTESARAVSIDISETYDVYVHHATNTELEYDTHFDDALKTQCWRSDDIEPELQPVVTVKTRRKSKTKDATVKKKIKDKSDGTRVRKCKKAKVEDEDAEDVNNKAKLKDEDAEHVNNEEVIKDKEKKDGKEAVECEICHKILTSKLSLRNHHKIHSGFDVVCEHCGKKFITRRLLLMHCRAKHGYEKTDKCSYCDYRASNAEQVKIHERLHTGERPYVCPHCNAGFHRQSSFLQHVAIHLPEKTVQCTQCPALFKSATLMRIHANRHRQPQYSFKCYVCGSSFARRRNVARHLQRIHALAAPLRDIERVRIA